MTGKSFRVLFATDGLGPANGARSLISKLADRSRVELTVLSVASYELLIPESDYYLLDNPEERTRHARATADQAADALRASGFEVQARTLEGAPGTKILGESENGYDLIVLGGGRNSWLGNILLGSTSTHVLHSSPVSVLIVHSTLETERARILLGVDGSDHSKMATDVVARFADPSRCHIKVVSVVSAPEVYAGAWDGPTMTAAQEDEVRRIRTSRAEDAVSEATSLLRDSGFEVKSSIVSGHPSRVLLEEGETGSFDLVAVGSRGLGPIHRTLVGSVSDHVARLSRAALVARQPSRTIAT